MRPWEKVIPDISGRILWNSGKNIFNLERRWLLQVFPGRYRKWTYINWRVRPTGWRKDHRLLPPGFSLALDVDTTTPTIYVHVLRRHTLRILYEIRHFSLHILLTPVDDLLFIWCAQKAPISTLRNNMKRQQWKQVCRVNILTNFLIYFNVISFPLFTQSDFFVFNFSMKTKENCEHWLRIGIQIKLHQIR